MHVYLLEAGHSLNSLSQSKQFPLPKRRNDINTVMLNVKLNNHKEHSFLYTHMQHNSQYPAVKDIKPKSKELYCGYGYRI